MLHADNALQTGYKDIMMNISLEVGNMKHTTMDQ